MFSKTWTEGTFPTKYLGSRQAKWTCLTLELGRGVSLWDRDEHVHISQPKYMLEMIIGALRNMWDDISETVAAGVKTLQAWRKPACKGEMTSQFYPRLEIGDSLQCNYTLGVPLLYLKGTPSCLYLCVYIQCSVNWEGRFYTGLANMPSDCQSTLTDALLLLTVLISPGDADLIVMWVLGLGSSPKFTGPLCTKWYLEIIFSSHGRVSSFFLSPHRCQGLWGGNTCQPLSPWPRQAGEAFSQASQMNGH